MTDYEDYEDYQFNPKEISFQEDIPQCVYDFILSNAVERRRGAPDTRRSPATWKVTSIGDNSVWNVLGGGDHTHYCTYDHSTGYSGRQSWKCYQCDLVISISGSYVKKSTLSWSYPPRPGGQSRTRAWEYSRTSRTGARDLRPRHLED